MMAQHSIGLMRGILLGLMLWPSLSSALPNSNTDLPAEPDLNTDAPAANNPTEEPSQDNNNRMENPRFQTLPRPH
ncbi:hypothetical protein AAFF_G00303940 [Aldrovandia affinis]|uniref:Uncharacterized protein n=1 Tax=Aldrovandia affinis TaxID=143900 RepID=A0AAD7SPE7_9TELE|nr:hypothetical protein AAFF_G00303940 [Aldrovandia affinis]